MGKVSLGLGLGVGYVLGAQAGRARYEQIRQAAARIVERPDVQQALEKARTAAPAPLRSGIEKLTGSGSGGRSGGPQPAAEAGGGGSAPPDAPLPDPLIPPAESNSSTG
jgi:hypothetical protein